MIFALSAILLIVSPIASMTKTEASAFFRIGACLNYADKSLTGNGVWPSNIVKTVNNVCDSAIGGDGNIAASCAALRRAQNGQRQPNVYERNTVSKSLNKFGNDYQWAIVDAFGNLGNLKKDASGQYCWSLYLSDKYGNVDACN